MGRPRKPGPARSTARSFKELKGWPQEALDYLFTQYERKSLGAGPTLEELLIDLHGRFGVTWNDSSMSRHYGYWLKVIRPFDDAREEARLIVESLAGHSTEEMREAATQLLQAARMRAVVKLDDVDPDTVVGLALQQDRVQLDQDKLGVEREKLALAQQRLDHLRAGVKAASDELERVSKKGALAPEDLATIREQLYGLTGDPAPA